MVDEQVIIGTALKGQTLDGAEVLQSIRSVIPCKVNGAEQFTAVLQKIIIRSPRERQADDARTELIEQDIFVGPSREGERIDNAEIGERVYTVVATEVERQPNCSEVFEQIVIGPTLEHQAID